MNYLSQNYPNIWLPYTQMKTAELPLPVKSAEGSYIILEDGRRLLDGISSWWSVCHGYQHPHLVNEIKKQTETLSHIMFAGLAHEPAYKLAGRLIKLTPEGLTRVFFADSGSTSVEIAMKMCVQYWRNKGEKRRNKFVSFKNGYHGDTMGAISLSDPEGWISKAFNNYAPLQYVVDIPSDEYGFSEFEAMLKAEKKNIAGLIIEPLVQGAGGMKFHSADILAEIYNICKRNDILFIADEIMTGFYRTGYKFACDEAGISPDIMCVGKALTGGMISLAASIAKEEIFEAFLDDTLEKAFMHGPTFMANPLACSAANASLDLFEREDFTKKIEFIENYFSSKFKEFEQIEIVADVRVKGAIVVIELNPDKIKNDIWKFIFELRKKFVSQNLWLRPFKNIIYVMPNYNISLSELDFIKKTIKNVLTS
ncbi:MAG: adenosylmethionine--8-amino-7-oxononanoate transaminase [Rickettsiales bacterium]|nr:adenosylmethionine--8-amino-7-oxononanoate transaminase [Rickettsiales bacterium]